MSSFSKIIHLRPHTHAPYLDGVIKLASMHTAHFMNLILDLGASLGCKSVTFSADQAKRLRDALNEAYPVEAPAAATTDKGFKVGDKVRVATYRHGPRQHGCEGVVTSIRGVGSLQIIVDFAGSKKIAPTPRNFYSAGDLELVPTTEQTGRFIVSLLEGSGYKPGARPVVHTTFTAATAEATRLATVHGGTFHVLRAAFEASREKPVVPPVKTATL